MGDDKGGFLDPLDDIGHGKGLPGAGHPQEDLVFLPLQYPRAQFLDGLGLISRGLEFRNELKCSHIRLSASFAAHIPLADAWRRPRVIPAPSPIMKRLSISDSRFPVNLMRWE